MNCIETRKYLEELLDGELFGELKEAVESHLRICAGCCEAKEQMRSLSNLLQVSQFNLPSAKFDKRVMTSFKAHHKSEISRWRSLIFGGFIIPKPAFAAFLILAIAGMWLAFQFGKLNSTSISIASPSVIADTVQIPTETNIQTVVVEVPVIREKTVTRTIYMREPKINKKEKAEIPAAITKQNNLPLYSSSVAENGYFTDVNLKGFQPAAEISARIIKEEKETDK